MSDDIIKENWDALEETLTRMTVADSPGLSSITGTLDLLTLRHNLNMVLWGHKGTVIDNDSTPALSKALEECVIRTMESYRR